MHGTHSVGLALVLVLAATVRVSLEADVAVAPKRSDVVDANAVQASTVLETLVNVDARRAVEPETESMNLASKMNSEDREDIFGGHFS